MAISVGVLLLSGLTPGAAGSGNAMDRRAIALAGLAGLHVAAYTMLDGLGVRSSPRPFDYISYFFVLEGSTMALVLVFSRRGRLAAVWRENYRGALWGGFGTALAFGIALWALGQMPIALVSALRETNCLFATLIGVLIFREGLGPRRLVAALIIVVGVVAINLPLDLQAG